MIYLEKERRLNEALRNYWEALRGSRPFPSEDDLDFDQIQFLWDECFLLQSRDIRATKDYNFTYLGKTIQMAYQSGQIPFCIKGVIATDANHLAEEFLRMLSHPQSVMSEGEHPIPGRGTFRYRQILLPLGHTPERVDAVMGRLGFRVYLDEEG